MNGCRGLKKRGSCYMTITESLSFNFQNRGINGTHAKHLVED
jgi:hypothetical protein